MNGTLNSLLDHAVNQFGLDRSYTVKFGLDGKNPMVWVKEDDVLLASLWFDDGEMRAALYYK
jgi:hypothetical protein